MRFPVWILFILIILVSGCAGQQAQTSEGTAQQTQQAAPAQQLVQTVSSNFPDGWQLTKSEENPSPGILLAKDVSSFYGRGSEQLIIKSQTYKDAANARGIYETLQTSLQNTETFSAGDGALVASSDTSLIAAGYKGDLYVNVRYANQQDGSYKSGNLASEKELVRNVVRALLS